MMSHYPFSKTPQIEGWRFFLNFDCPTRPSSLQSKRRKITLLPSFPIFERQTTGQTKVGNFSFREKQVKMIILFITSQPEQTIFLISEQKRTLSFASYVPEEFAATSFQFNKISTSTTPLTNWVNNPLLQRQKRGQFKLKGLCANLRAMKKLHNISSLSTCFGFLKVQETTPWFTNPSRRLLSFTTEKHTETQTQR